MAAYLDLRLAASLAALLILYPISLAIYRLAFSQLAGFPGPMIAAATDWYEFYYDFFCHGRYIFEIEKMHQKYGPIVRVNSTELSIHDPAAYNDIYVGQSKRRTDNYIQFCKGIDFDGSHALTTSHDLHRRRRRPLDPFFSRQGVSRLEPMLAEVGGKFVARLNALKGTNSVIRLDHAFSAFSGDIIGRICWENNTEFLDDPHFAPEWYNSVHIIIRSLPLFTGFPSLIQIVGLIPEKVLLWAFPSGQNFKEFKKIALHHISVAKREKLENDHKSIRMENDVSLFRHIVNSDMPESELSDDRLAKEAQVLLAAGTASTARTLGFISYYILANPHIHSRLEEELRDTMASYPEHMPSWAELEKVQYLQALIKEGLRLSYGSMHRLPHCSPDVPIQYKEWTIPPGVPIGMSAYLMHTDPSVYEKPFEFIPERWLGDVKPSMNNNFVPFSRGSRSCLGKNLAAAELTILLAVLYQPNGPTLELFETDESDVAHIHDFVLPLPKLSTKGVRVLIR